MYIIYIIHIYVCMYICKYIGIYAFMCAGAAWERGPGGAVGLAPGVGQGEGIKGALQLLINRYGYIRVAQIPERGSTQSFVVLIRGDSKSNHLGVQGTFKEFRCVCMHVCMYRYRYRLYACIYADETWVRGPSRTVGLTYGWGKGRELRNLDLYVCM